MRTLWDAYFGLITLCWDLLKRSTAAHETEPFVSQTCGADHRAAAPGNYSGEDRAEPGHRHLSGCLSPCRHYDRAVHSRRDSISPESPRNTVGELSRLSAAAGFTDSLHSPGRNHFSGAACLVVADRYS